MNSIYLIPGVGSFGPGGFAPVGPQILMPAGSTALLPSYSWVIDPDTGMWRPGAGKIEFSSDGVSYQRLFHGALQQLSTATLEWSSGALGASSDITLSRLAAGALNLIQDSTHGICFNVTVDATLYVKSRTGGAATLQADTIGTSLAHIQDGGSGVFNFLLSTNAAGVQLDASTAGTASFRTIAAGDTAIVKSLRHVGGANTAGNPAFSFAGLLTDGFSDDGSEISVYQGGAKVFAWRSARFILYQGSSQVIEWSAASKIAGGAVDGNIKLSDNAGTAFGLLQLGGITNAYPAWKRSGASLLLRLADDSAYTELITGGLVSRGDTQFRADIATPAGGSAAARIALGTTSGFAVYYGSDAPTVTAAKGSLYLRSNGSGINDRAYINTDGGTTWTALVTVG